MLLQTSSASNKYQLVLRVSHVFCGSRRLSLTAPAGRGELPSFPCPGRFKRMFTSSTAEAKCKQMVDRCEGSQEGESCLGKRFWRCHSAFTPKHPTGISRVWRKSCTTRKSVSIAYVVSQEGLNFHTGQSTVKEGQAAEGRTYSRRQVTHLRSDGRGHPQLLRAPLQPPFRMPGLRC